MHAAMIGGEVSRIAGGDAEKKEIETSTFGLE
jgi:hypothetical protein